jgi:uncharacterized protein YgbK (DUF1537 family)
MNKRLFCSYGDDFMGCTDTLEALARIVWRAVLFLEPGAQEAIAAFRGCRAIGVASESRSRPSGGKVGSTFGPS